MAYRYSNTDKWGDSWFSNLRPPEKLLFNYLCDNCDIAGFIELNIKRWASDIGYDKGIIEGALKGLQRGFIYSLSGDCIYIRTYLKHQKNLPLNPEKNMAHRGIINRFALYSNKFNITSIEEFIEGACKGLQSPYGNGSGNGSGNGKEGRESQKFIIPTIEEIKLKMQERNLTSFTAEAFHAHYTTNGWMVGKNKMKDWNSALTTWNEKSKEYNGKNKQDHREQLKHPNAQW